MNQILEPEQNITQDFISDKNKKVDNIRKYKLQFIIFTIIAVILIFIFIFRFFTQGRKESLSQKLISQYSVSKIYANEIDNYSLSLYSNNMKNNTPFVIGMIRINKINLNYPILSETTNDLLEISLCRFAGPMPNELGNLCIAGHNYVDYKLFSRLFEINIGDDIEIYDLNGKMLKYIVFNKYETNSDDVSCTDQNTNGQRIITLLTCNNVNGKRLVVVAKES